MTTKQLKQKLIDDIHKQLYFDPRTLFEILVEMNKHYRITDNGAIIARWKFD